MCKFPLYTNDGKWTWPLSHKQKIALSSLKEDITNGSLKLVENHCLCGNDKEQDDIVISEKDRYGLPLPQVLCKKCGLIRSKLVFDNESNELFYKNSYRKIYTTGSPTDFFFFNQVKHGEKFVKILESKDILSKIDNVAEIGCGAGGILLPFLKHEKNVSGYDFNKEYLDFGNKFRLNLNFGDYSEQLKDDSCDLIILSHVMEHFLYPIKEIYDIAKKIKMGKYLLVEIPSSLDIAKAYKNPIFYFQNAHIYNFYQDYLKVFFDSLGFKVEYSDELCIFLLKKERNTSMPEFIYNKSLKNNSMHIANYLLGSKKQWQTPKNIIYRIYYRFNTVVMLYRSLFMIKWKLTHKNFAK